MLPTKVSRFAALTFTFSILVAATRSLFPSLDCWCAFVSQVSNLEKGKEITPITAKEIYTYKKEEEKNTLWIEKTESNLNIPSNGSIRGSQVSNCVLKADAAIEETSTAFIASS